MTDLHYNEGGDLPSAVVTVVNASGEPITVETAEQVKAGIREGYVPGQWGDLTATRHDDGRITLEGDSEFVGFSTEVFAIPGSGIRLQDSHIVIDAEGDWRFEIVAFESQGRVVVGRRIPCPGSPANQDA